MAPAGIMGWSTISAFGMALLSKSFRHYGWMGVLAAPPLVEANRLGEGL